MKAEVLAARPNGLRNVLWLRRRHHEDDVRRRLFQRLQQGIKSGFGNLMRFVEDVDLVAVARRSIAGRVAQLANFINAAIRGRVDFNDIDCRTLPNLGAGVAGAAGLRRRPLRRAQFSAAVQRLRQDARNRRFADTAMAGEDVTVRNPVLTERVEQRSSHVVLTGDVGKALRTILPGQNLIPHANPLLELPVFVSSLEGIVSFRAGCGSTETSSPDDPPHSCLDARPTPGL